MEDKLTPHPAKFSDPILLVIANIITHHYPYLTEHKNPHNNLYILDPMAGIGKIHLLRDVIPGLHTWGVELEEEWADQSPYTEQGNALDLSMVGNPDLIVTSPAYGNRMADNYAGDPSNSRRHTYRIDLGRQLSPGNGAAMQWGDTYKAFHMRVWAECVKVTKHDGLIIVNTKDHIRDGKPQPVSRWHWMALERLGCVMEEEHKVEVPGMRHGQNGDARISYEHVAVFRVNKGYERE